MLPALKVLDWNATGKVTEARHQQSCGSCWVFAAMGAIESKLLINTKTTASLVPTLNLAEQQIVSAIQCAPTHGQPASFLLCSLLVLSPRPTATLRLHGAPAQPATAALAGFMRQVVPRRSTNWLQRRPL